MPKGKDTKFFLLKMLKCLYLQKKVNRFCSFNLIYVEKLYEAIKPF